MTNLFVSDLSIDQVGAIRRWIAALRSGTYTQGYGNLRLANDTYCCLGVAEDLEGAKWLHNKDEHHYCFLGADNRRFSGVMERFELYGLEDAAGSFQDPKFKYNSLVAMNDGGETFTVIADLLESHLEQRLKGSADAAQ